MAHAFEKHILKMRFSPMCPRLFTMKAELEIGTHSQITVAEKLDYDDELELQVDYESGSVYLTIKDMKKLRDHLNTLLEEHEGKQECQRCHWPTRVGHHAYCPYRTDFS